MEPPETKLHTRATDGSLWVLTALAVFNNEVKWAKKAEIVVTTNTTTRPVRIPLNEKRPQQQQQQQQQQRITAKGFQLL